MESLFHTLTRNTFTTVAAQSSDTVLTNAGYTINDPAMINLGSSNAISKNHVSTSQKSSALSKETIVPIAYLNPHDKKWTIKARVISKTRIRYWKNARGEGKLFSITLMDETAEIKGTCFAAVCDKYFDLIHVDDVYYIAKGIIKEANKQFTTIENEYEITFTSHTVVEKCYDDSGTVPKISYNFVPLSQIAQMDGNAVVG